MNTQDDTLVPWSICDAALVSLLLTVALLSTVTGKDDALVDCFADTSCA